jgi:hypothetical protein
MSATNTIYRLNADPIAQITGTGNALAGFPSSVGSGFAPTYAASIDIGPLLHYTRWINIVTTSAVGNATLTCSVIKNPGSIIVVQINNDAGGARTITLSTGFRFSAATLVGTASKIMLVTFVSDGLTYNEISRTVAET